LAGGSTQRKTGNRQLQRAPEGNENEKIRFVAAVGRKGDEKALASESYSSDYHKKPRVLLSELKVIITGRIKKKKGKGYQEKISNMCDRGRKLGKTEVGGGKGLQGPPRKNRAR